MLSPKSSQGLVRIAFPKNILFGGETPAFCSLGVSHAAGDSASCSPSQDASLDQAIHSSLDEYVYHGIITKIRVHLVKRHSS